MPVCYATVATTESKSKDNNSAQKNKKKIVPGVGRTPLNRRAREGVDDDWMMSAQCCHSPFGLTNNG